MSALPYIAVWLILSGPIALLLGAATKAGRR